MIELGKLRHQGEKPRALAGPRIFPRLKLDPALVGKLLHRLHECQPFLLHDELEGIARLAASEAVIETLGRIDVEARRLLVMKRTARLDARPHVLHLNAIR